MLHNISNSPVEYGSSISFIKTDLPILVPIAPAPEKKYSSVNLENSEKKRYNSQSNPYTGAQAASIARRNARERNRVKQVNDGFNALRKRLPSAIVDALSGGSRRGSGKKLSKVDTLRMVVEYIRHLQQMIGESNASFETTRIENNTIDTYNMDEGVFGGRNSPYSESVPSPAGSECSSGVSSAYSTSYYQNYQVSENQMTPMEEDELLDAISWWQQK